MATGILGAFREIDAATDAIAELRRIRFNEITVYTPTPRHEFEHALDRPESPVRRFTLIGGLLGATFGYWIAIWASDYWPLVVGGKPIASWVPYTIFGFEVMVLIGSLSTVFGLFALSLAPVSCSWFTDFKDQPKMEPWESVADSVPPRGNPQNSVPIQGSQAPGFIVSRQPLPSTIDSMSTIANPIPADARSLDNGRKLFQINCAVCHGPMGQGNGRAVTYGMAGINLVNDRVRGFTDGYIWGMIRNGRGLMPSYNRIEELERWDVVNYLRGLQGRYPVDTAAPRPGITGTALPSASVAAPTRSAPYFNAVRGAPGGVPLGGTAAARATSPTGGEGAAQGAPATSDSAAAARTPPPPP